jgi:type IV pilus assembly protein PilC
MQKFAFTAVDPGGATVTGLERAPSREAAAHALVDRGLLDVSLKPKSSFLQKEVRPQRVKRAELMHLSRQLGAFINAGLPLVEAVRTIGSEAGNNSVRRVMADIERGLRDGDRLSDCLDRHPRVFPEYYRGILRSAELTGHLDTVLDRLAVYLERDLEARRRVTSALIYPVIIAVMSVATVIVLAGFVLPRFKTFFDDLHATLPLPTRMLLATTNFLTSYWWALIAGIVVLAVVHVLVLQTTRGRLAWDRMVLRLPVIGGTVRFALVERFSRVLSSMVSAGVTLPEALRVATGSLRNRVFVTKLARVREALIEGEGLARPIGESGLFPSTASQMIRVGEETGTLDQQLEATAHYYEGELDYRLKKLTSLLEPAVIVLMGLVVGFVAIALVSAMYGIFNQVKV